MLTKEAVGPAIVGVSTKDVPSGLDGRGSGARLTKRALDVTVALTALIVFGALFALIALAVLVSQGRPIFIRHQRIGRGGASFPCLKFRTMVRDADAALVRHLAADPGAMLEWRATQKLRRDPRVTALGRVLRETSLDELPQLVNIVRGEMSLVGPRPIVTAEIAHYGGAFADYRSVRPGLTGLWQCSGRNDLGYEQRVMLDRQYVRTWSLWLDLAILLRTVPAVLRSRGVY